MIREKTKTKNKTVCANHPTMKLTRANSLYPSPAGELTADFGASQRQRRAWLARPPSAVLDRRAPLRPTPSCPPACAISIYTPSSCAIIMLMQPSPRTIVTFHHHVYTISMHNRYVSSCTLSKYHQQQPANVSLLSRTKYDAIIMPH